MVALWLLEGFHPVLGVKESLCTIFFGTPCTSSDTYRHIISNGIYSQESWIYRVECFLFVPLYFVSAKPKKIKPTPTSTNVSDRSYCVNKTFVIFAQVHCVQLFCICSSSRFETSTGEEANFCFEIGAWAFLMSFWNTKYWLRWLQYICRLLQLSSLQMISDLGDNEVIIFSRLALMAVCIYYLLLSPL